ncbi:MAG: SIS domain-containing protein [Xenococcaceae cyanobacterium MO_188.B32]|nr:SIS domain-containing protein [Xenococcaceae cyanobacterium MO_188.B32]
MNQNQLSPSSLVASELGALVDSSIRESIQVKQILLEEMIPKIVNTAEQIISTLKRGNKILVMGNGGSAADAQHIAAELVGRFERERRSLPIMALTSDTSVLTAIANDYGVDQLFARQIEGLGTPGDLILAISTSGNSRNILEGVKTARAKGLNVIGLTGETGGELESLCPLSLCVPSSRTARIQEAHTTICHVLCEAVEASLEQKPAKITPITQEFSQNIPKLVDSLEESYQENFNLSQVKLLILDFDGVLTDNRVLVSQDGTESVWCNRGDGWGIARLKEKGIEILVLSTELNQVVRARCQKLGINCIHGCDDKLAVLRHLIAERSLSLEQVAYVGNDVNDLACMSYIGIPIAVADAVPEIKDVAQIITTNRGGEGAVREVADLILEALATQQTTSQN